MLSVRHTNHTSKNVADLTFKNFHCCLIRDTIISKNFSFSFFISTSLTKVEAHLSGEQDQKLLTLYETMHVQQALRSKG